VSERTGRRERVGPGAGVGLVDLVREGVVDAELGALLWLLVEGGVPLVVTGTVPASARSAVAGAVLGAPPGRPWALLDADESVPSAERLAAVLQGGLGLGVSLATAGLRDLLARLTMPPHGLPEDAVRRLGVVLVLAGTDSAAAAAGDEARLGEGSVRLERLRAAAVHYLRPTERDAEGHVQRRPPAVLATWDPRAGAFEHFAWGITPELADRVDRSQADLERRQADRAAFLARVARSGPLPAVEVERRVLEHLAAEPPREPAPPHEPPRPPAPGGLTDRHVH
jgi:hypothetical protein